MAIVLKSFPCLLLIAGTVCISVIIIANISFLPWNSTILHLIADTSNIRIPPTKEMLKLSVQLLFVLGGGIFAFHAFLEHVLHRFKGFLPKGHSVDLMVNEGKVAEQREKQQEEYKHVSRKFEEKVLEPRMERKLLEKEKEHFRFRGNSPFKGQGQTLGSDDSAVLTETTPERQARRLPRNVEETEIRLAEERLAEERLAKQRQTEATKALRTPPLVLPEEPPKGEGVLTVGLRTPQGKVHKRRFHVNTRVEELFTFMSKLGFHQSKYGLAASYPRQFLMNPELHLADVGIQKDTMLNIEMIEQENNTT